MIEKVPVSSVIEKPISGEWGEEGGNVNVLRTTNFTNTGEISFKDVVKRNISQKKTDEKKLRYGDTIIEKSGGSPSQPVGRVVFYDRGNEEAFLCNNFTSVLRPKNTVFPKYFFWFLFKNHIFKKTLSFQNKTTGIINLQTERYLKETAIPVPPLAIQKAIAEKLDKADALRKKDKELLKYYDELAQSVFIDMFGDPVKNEKGWEKVSLGEICDVKGGKRVPLHHKLVKENTGFPYIKAGNIKNGKVTVKDLEFLLPETQKLIKRYIVDEGDVCITVVGANIGDIGIVPPQLDKANLTENANKLLIKSKDRLLNYFLCYQMRSDFVQQQINKRIMAVGVPKLAIFRVQELEILLPPLNLQSEFSTAMENIELQKSIVKQQAKESENLFQALLQESFS